MDYMKYLNSLIPMILNMLAQVKEITITKYIYFFNIFQTYFGKNMIIIKDILIILRKLICENDFIQSLPLIIIFKYKKLNSFFPISKLSNKYLMKNQIKYMYMFIKLFCSNI